jgi:glycosyltransferase involved in cell wall biosynthesis
LEKLAAELSIADAVHFVGTRADIPEMLGLMDVFVLSSHCEANPVSILEAMACEKPVVATRVGSVPETVHDGATGYLVSPNDVEQTAARIRELLENPERATMFGRAGRIKIIGEWSIDGMVRGYMELLEEIYRRKTEPQSNTRPKETNTPPILRR